jgi:hypothetical protein
MDTKRKRRVTAGPPSKLARPMVLKIPAPIIAAMPNEVKSLTPNILLSPDSPCEPSLCFKTLEMDFRLKIEFSGI